MRIASTIRLAATTAIIAGSLFAAVASARPPGIMYMHRFYSDASHTTQVGFYVDRCRNGDVVASPVNGTTSPYSTQEAVGSCPGGYW
ncbi:hypothetical protein SH203_02228 [Brevundimonas sp. SH203]|uniref:hypothetical protein n=1 Tax=Brevundimonas sp. SH203 TaxID=345167 RepID=UPI0009C9E1DE|nr:hypothetical protein [Brevundimonas sp. SH203]GAW41817.1 hypothetical protein SH203_02228 [Brevundimonas sp. SH203]